MTKAARSNKADRRAAWIAGVLFLNAIVFLFAGEALYRPMLDPLDLGTIATQRSVFLLGVLAEWVCSVPLILMIPILLFPVLGRYSIRSAAGYLAFRLLEVSLLTLADVAKLHVLDLARWEDRAAAETLARAAMERAAWIDSAGLVYNLTFGTGALILFGTLLAARLIPRALSLFGLIATIVLMLGSLLFSYGVVPAALGPAIWGPIALSEIALALWLIVKGFAPEG